MLPTLGDPDLAFALGSLMVVLAVPGWLSARVDGRFPSAGLFAGVGGAVMMALAWASVPGGYVGRVPEVYYDVLGRVL
ncbi:MAG: hypothetical protein ACU0CO_12570 [Shimia sp.]